jgi:hypothetical protein
LDTIIAGVLQAAVILFWFFVASLIVGASVILYTYWQRDIAKG